MRALEFKVRDKVFVRCHSDNKLIEVEVTHIDNADGPNTVITTYGYGKPFYALNRPESDPYADRYFIALRGDGKYDQLVPAIPEIVGQWKLQKANILLTRINNLVGAGSANLTSHPAIRTYLREMVDLLTPEPVSA